MMDEDFGSKDDKMGHIVIGGENNEGKEIQIILRLFLVVAMYCQASSSQFNQSLNLPRC